MKIDLYSRYPELEGCGEQIEKVLEMMKETYGNGGKLLLCGNGGSCADCDHIAGELLKGFLEKRVPDAELQKRLSERFPNDAEYLMGNLQRGIPAISLAAHAGVMTAFANDVDPNMIYAQLVYAYAKPNDMVIGISTSGNSVNVVNAIKIASTMGIKSALLCGAKECRLDGICDAVIHAPETETYKVQEYHLPIYHYLCAMLEDYAFCNK